ncbi:hypothetical protein GAYE_SCF09G3146 [Galdieria yellowstonensis]|uniref:methylmalonate-semialdehyde dehydrogenase (CoA acylating) n=1 Tax=Galdieria yellowstonensis TaxID=3028027 RepID=A0AAV9ID30_9RHOD|nr:hypothetical protein GAYE_SCF09G3146 [Galdieria yellowstonensis]
MVSWVDMWKRATVPTLGRIYYPKRLVETFAKKETTKLPVVHNFVGGKFVASQGPIIQTVTNPATGESLQSVPSTTKQEVDHVVQVAQEAFESWSKMPMGRRLNYIFQLREGVRKRSAEIAQVITRELGKTPADAQGDVARGLEIVEYSCGAAGKLEGMFQKNVATNVDMMQMREPLGVCLGVCPFNFPAMIPLWMLPMSTVVGNTIVLKPSELVPGAVELIAQVVDEAKFPPGVFNVVQGGKETVDHLLEHPGIKAVSFVGSTPVGRHIYRKASERGIRAQCNMGAKNHAVIMPDAAKDTALNALVGAAFGASGQRCMAISVAVFVGEAGNWIPELVKKTQTLVLGTTEKSDLGPLVTEKAKQRVEKLIQSAESQGAKIEYRASVPFSSGNWVGPTIISQVQPHMDVYQQEIFGPVLSCIRVDTLEDAIQLINQNPYGNGTSIFTQSGVAARMFQSNIQVGQVGINLPIPVPAPPFGFTGSKDSMWGDLPFYGSTGFEFYTRPKTVITRWDEKVLDAIHTSMPLHR